MIIISKGPGRDNGSLEETLHFTEAGDLLVASRAVQRFGPDFAEAELIMRTPTSTDQRAESAQEAELRQEVARAIAADLHTDIVAQYARTLRGYNIGDILFRHSDVPIIRGSIGGLAEQDETDLSLVEQHFTDAARHLMHVSIGDETAPFKPVPGPLLASSRPSVQQR